MFRRVTNPCQCRLFVQRRAPFEANPGKHWVFKGYNLLRGVRNVRNTAYYGGKRYESLFGKASPDKVRLHPRYLYDPMLAHTPQKGYVASVRIGGKEYR